MDISAIILAGGQGKRMHSQLPKVLHKLAGRPLIEYPIRLLRALEGEPIVVVVSYKAELVKKTVEKLNKAILFAYQPKPLGTGDAVRHALPLVKKSTTVMVLNGDDSAFYRPETLKRILDHHTRSGADMTFVTLEVDDPMGMGRIIRDTQGTFRSIVEDKIATDEQRKIKEINDGCYVFKTRWLVQNITKIPKSPVGEYYLTSLVEIGIYSGAKIQTYKLPDNNEWFGIDTRERLKEAEERFKKISNF
ncbi:NTP transferase domain-containing protein [Candidatus Microgenomates bacterium]|nr:NTP transferase domain-containing protein [Candidatus Microgenomates bacterium]